MNTGLRRCLVLSRPGYFHTSRVLCETPKGESKGPDDTATQAPKGPFIPIPGSYNQLSHLAKEEIKYKYQRERDEKLRQSVEKIRGRSKDVTDRVAEALAYRQRHAEEIERRKAQKEAAEKAQKEAEAAAAKAAEGSATAESENKDGEKKGWFSKWF